MSAKRYPDEIRQRAVRMVFEVRKQTGCWATRCLSMVATFGVRMLELRGVVGRPPPSAGAWVESV